jgi:hypothetical protein
MKFEYTGSYSPLTPNFNFNFNLSKDEIHKVSHKYGYHSDWFEKAFNDLNFNSPHTPYVAAFLISETILEDKVDMGINYKQKYEELVEILKPYKIDNDMSPATTLKMILKYQK